MRHWMVVGGLSLACVAPVGAQTVDMGTTFHQAERQATRVVTWFDDSYAVSERHGDGRVTSRLFDKATNAAVAQAERQERDDDARASVQARVGDTRVSLPVGRERTLAADWDHGQLRRLWHDARERQRRGRSRAARLVWHDGVLADANLVARVRPGRAVDPDAGIEAVATEFPGLIVVAQRDRHRVPQARVSYSTFTARMLSASTGREVGFVRWFDRARVVTWKFPNGAEGVMMESRVPGGFPFAPSMAWANVQATLFLEQSLRKAGDQMLKPAAARWASGLRVRRASTGDTCDGQSDGCTGMHYLDWMSVRECCDRHDLCFEAERTNCCTAWSWLAFWDRWECTKCNLQVVGCFVTWPFSGGGDGGGNGGDGGGGDSCSDGTVCTRCRMGDWCPPQCDSCGDAY
jgi:hypothetical protein